MNAEKRNAVNWDNSPRECKLCGTVFKPKAPNQIYCSRECLRRAKNAKQNEDARRAREWISPNMTKIREMVKNDPNYARAQIKEMKNGKVNRR